MCARGNTHPPEKREVGSGDRRRNAKVRSGETSSTLSPIGAHRSALEDQGIGDSARGRVSCTFRFSMKPQPMRSERDEVDDAVVDAGREGVVPIVVGESRERERERREGKVKHGVSHFRESASVGARVSQGGGGG